MIPVGVVDESDTLNDLQAFYADNENVAADIDPQLSSIIGNLMKDRLPEEKLKGELNGYIRPGNCPTLVDTRVNPEIWDKLSPPTRSRDIKLQRIQHSLVQAAVAVAVATGADTLVKAVRSGESLPSSKMALPVTALVRINNGAIGARAPGPRAPGGPQILNKQCFRTYSLSKQAACGPLV